MAPTRWMAVADATNFLLEEKMKTLFSTRQKYERYHYIMLILLGGAVV